MPSFNHIDASIVAPRAGLDAANTPLADLWACRHPGWQSVETHSNKKGH
jgi:hypothetical protein